MTSNRRDSSPSYEWSDTIPGPSIRNRIVRTPEAIQPTAVQRISLVFNNGLPTPAVTELDANTGWAEFEAAVERQESTR